MSSNRSKAQQLAAEVNALLGDGAVSLGDDPAFRTRVLPTGVLPIDYLIGGGLPRNRMTEIFGQYSTLKSYIGLRALGETQRAGGVGALVDTEHTYDASWATHCGVDTKSLLLRQPKTGEEAVDVTEALVRSGIDLVVWDSVAATLPQAEQQKRMDGEKTQPARLAQLMSLALRKLTAANSQTAYLWINQTRISVGVMFGDPEKAAGGLSLPFYATHRIALRKAGHERHDVKVKSGEGKQETVKEVTSYRVRATLEKSKLTMPHRDVLFSFDLSTGVVDDLDFLIALGLNTGVITMKGQTWTFNRTSKRGREVFRRWIESDPKVRGALLTSCLGSHEADRSKGASGKRVLRRKQG